MEPTPALLIPEPEIASMPFTPVSPEESFAVPFFRPQISEAEIDEVTDTLRSGWLTSGPKTKRFEQEFAKAVGSEYAVALNSCTAALHLAVVALGLSRGQAVLVPTMTFAATAEIIHYTGAVPILVDCDPESGNMDLDDAERKLGLFHSKKLSLPDDVVDVVGIVPVHVGGLMLNIKNIRDFAHKHGLWIVEDAAHAFPAAWRASAAADWQHCGNNTADVSCYSFYANKTITTGEGGMAVTNDAAIAERIRLLSLHGLSLDAWGRYSGSGAWDYQIVAAGYKYNLTDIASAIGIHQLARAESMRQSREMVADTYMRYFSHLDEVSLPPNDSDRIHSWHLFPLRLNLDRLSIDRNDFVGKMRERGVGFSVHWRPLHLHPFYMETYKYCTQDNFPVATNLWSRLVSLPIFSGMEEREVEHVAKVVTDICTAFRVKG